jgi:hypothetical protein
MSISSISSSFADYTAQSVQNPEQRLRQEFDPHQAAQKDFQQASSLSLSPDPSLPGSTEVSVSSLLPNPSLPGSTEVSVSRLSPNPSLPGSTNVSVSA